MENLFDLPLDWKMHWRQMPAFDQHDAMPFQSIKVNFYSPEDRDAFSRLIGRKLTAKTKCIRFPREERMVLRDKAYLAETNMAPRYPVYVISKGRWHSNRKYALTYKAFERMGVPYRIVVEPQERDLYAREVDPKKILVLPFSNLGMGSVPARNWVWEHSVREGHARHWIVDDNIKMFCRLHKNVSYQVLCGNIFRAMEDFVDRYENVALAGPQYVMFALAKQLHPPYDLNTRIYSCILIKNDIYPEGRRWRGIYNEDTDLSLRVLKDGWCTVLFYAFLQWKMPTMTMKGGNTDLLYFGDGREKMAKSLREQHPDCVKVSKRWGRWQHVVDYRKFAKNKLKPKWDIPLPDRLNEYSMYLGPVPRDEDEELVELEDNSR